MLVVFEIDERSSECSQLLAALTQTVGKYVVDRNRHSKPIVVFKLDTKDRERAATVLCDVAMLLVPRAVKGIKEKRLPPLYQSGVKYEKQNPRACAFRYPDDIYSKGGGDCKQLVLWRLAECAMSGEQCNPRVIWLNNRKGLQAHMQLRRGDKTIEDPSVILGMTKPRGNYL